MQTTCNLWHNLINGFIITYLRAVRDRGVRESKVGGGLESYVIRSPWKLVLQCHGHQMSLGWEQICLDIVLKVVWPYNKHEYQMPLVCTWWQIFWIWDKVEDVFFFFQVKQFSVLIMLNKNRIWVVTWVEHISICLNNLSNSGYLALLFDSDIKGVQSDWWS